MDEGKPIHRYWRLNKDPTYFTKGIVAVEDKCSDRRWLTFEGIIKPKGKETREWLVPGNPNKRIVAHVDKLDEGKVIILEDSPTFISFMFYGKKLKGYWVMRKASPRETVWTFEQSELPKAYKGKNLENRRNLQRIPIQKQEEIVRLTKQGKSRPYIAKAVGVSKQTVYAYQRLYNLL
ncbi:MAG: helix-turn-helix domain-containing protein [Candidatus Heimdallarchaeota archaeon]